MTNPVFLSFYLGRVRRGEQELSSVPEPYRTAVGEVLNQASHPEPDPSEAVEDL